MLTVMDWFAGAGGSSQGAAAVPGVHVERAANHWLRAIESHSRNFPDTDHYKGDIREAPVHRWPVCDIFWASPECPAWSSANGRRRDFIHSLQGDLFGRSTSDETERSRALMEEVPMYLRGVVDRGGLVKVGVVENVVDVRGWDQWDRWLDEIRKLDYHVRVIALNSMHANPRTVYQAPQSRDRLYVAYWHRTLGRTPDWDKWLRPRAWCGSCEQWVSAIQAWKRPGVDMGRYRQQYLYRCPQVTCRYSVVEPRVLPAAAAIDWTLPGQRIGDRIKPLAPKTLARINAGLARFAHPVVVPAGGTWRDAATSAADPMPTRTTTENDGVAIPPFLIPLRSGRNRAVLAGADPLATVVADGSNHGLVVSSGSDTPDTHVDWRTLLIPYYGTGTARTVAEPIGALSTRDRYGLVQSTDIAVEDVLFRMLEPHEIGRAMSFSRDYVVLGNKREKVRQYGNAVTPNVAEVIICALAEVITGEQLDRHIADREELAA